MGPTGWAWTEVAFKKELLGMSDGHKWGISERGLTTYSLYIVKGPQLRYENVHIEYLVGGLQSTLGLTCFQ